MAKVSIRLKGFVNFLKSIGKRKDLFGRMIQDERSYWSISQHTRYCVLLYISSRHTLKQMESSIWKEIGVIIKRILNHPVVPPNWRKYVLFFFHPVGGLEGLRRRQLPSGGICPTWRSSKWRLLRDKCRTPRDSGLVQRRLSTIIDTRHTCLTSIKYLLKGKISELSRTPL